MTDLNKYIALKAALLNEQAKLEARLNAINKVLGGDVVITAAPTPAPTSPAPATTTTPGKRTFSAATRAKMKASQKLRWAAKKGKAAGKAIADAVPVPAPKQAKQTMSEATKAKMSAAHQARWAKKKGTADATKAPAAVPASTSAPTPKKKRKMSAEGKANIRAAVKARWAKANALKAKAVGK